MVGDIYLNIYRSVCTIIKVHTNDMLAKYCITGIFPRTFIFRKNDDFNYFPFLFSQPAHGGTDTKFSVNATNCLNC